ncbi:MAG: PAS domain S-box protein [Bacteroidales bacterium]|nr:PAS domain S-box protein [Bacteroidales bacterium]
MKIPESENNSLQKELGSLKRKLSALEKEVEKKRLLEQELMASEKKMRSIFRAAPTGIGVGKEWILLEANEHLCSMTGYKKEELIGKSARILYPSQEEFERVGKEKYAQIAEKEIGQLETQWQKKDGTIIHILLTSSSVEDSGLEGGVTFTALDITERVEMHTALNMVVEQYKNLFNSIRDSILVSDTNRKIIQYNPAFSDLFGYLPGEIEGEKTSVIYKDLDEFREMGTRLMENIDNPNFILTVSYKKKNGEIFTGETNVFYLRNQDGEITGFIGTIRDVSERMEAEKKLEYSYNLMRFIIEHTNSAVAVHDRDLNYVYVSQRYLDDYNITDRDVIGKHHYEVFPDLPRKWRNVHQRALAGEISSSERDPYFKENGEVVWTRWECRPWFESDGSIGGIIVYTEVITKRVLAEEAVKESERKLSTLLSNLPGMAYRCLYDSDYTMKFISAGCIDFTGYEPKELIDNSVISYAALIHPDDAEMVWNSIQNAVADDQPFVIEYRIIDREGKERWFWEQGCEVSKTKDRDLILEGFITEITDRKRVEKELLKIKSSLEEQVEERTRELKERINELERFHQATIEREFRIKELQDEINRLKKENQ